MFVSTLVLLPMLPAIQRFSLDSCFRFEDVGDGNTYLSPLFFLCFQLGGLLFIGFVSYISRIFSSKGRAYYCSL